MEKKQGVGLLDIGPITELVEVGNNQDVEVRGISAQDILTLIQKFPDMQKFVSIGGISPKDIMNLAPGTVAGIIAAGAGHVGEDEYEAKAGTLSVEVQFDLLEAIGRCTFRNGFGPFVMRISAIVVAALSEHHGKVTGTNLRPPSKPSSVPATPPHTSGP